MVVKNNIKKWREYRHYSQDYMAEMLDITQQAYSLIETGPTKVDTEMLALIAAILKVPIEKFYLPDGQIENGLPMKETDVELRDKLLEAKDQVIATKDQLLVTKDEVIASKNKVIALQDAMLENGKGKKKRA